MNNDVHRTKVLVKICGLREIAQVDAALDAGADFLGVVFAQSPRWITVERARAIRARVGPRVEVVDATAAAFAAARHKTGRPLLVGVFANQTPDEINRIATEVDLDIVQLSGGEHPSLEGRLMRPVLRAVHVGPDDTAERILAEAGRPPATVTLLDTKGALRGGSGRPFDWAIAEAVARARPIMLAGGLTPDNVAEAIMSVMPWAVDVSSGVESVGQKDVAKIKAFVEAAKQAMQSTGAGV